MEFKKFYCTVDGCSFNKKKFFKREFLLNQHFLNCHTEKKFKCLNCSKQYAMKWQLKYHSKACGLDWVCLTCKKQYKERLSLITHCKRNQHKLPENAKFDKIIKKAKKQIYTVLLPVPSNKNFIKPKFVPILPKLNNCNDVCDKEKIDEKTFWNSKKKLIENTVYLNNNSNLQFINNSCQTEDLCQCKNKGLTQCQFLQEKQKKSTKSFSAQCPEENYFTSINKKLIKKVTNKDITLKSHYTQTIDSSFDEKPKTSYKSTCTDINLSNILISKKKTVAIETNINGLNKNYCFVNKDDIYYNKFEKSSINHLKTDNQDPMLTTVSVQTDELELTNNSSSCFNIELNYGDLEILELNDIQTQTYWNLTDNFTQTDFPLEFNNILDYI